MKRNRRGSLARRSTSWFVVGLALWTTGLSGTQASESREPVDRFGGWGEEPLGAAKRFRVATWRGGAWLVTPEGHPFLGVGLAHANWPHPATRAQDDATDARFGEDRARYYEDRAAWMAEAGFNAFSYTSPAPEQGAVPWIATLPLIPGFINHGPRPIDLFDPAWRANATAVIDRELPALLRDPFLIGVSLAYPVLASPHAMPDWGWSRLGRAPTNLLRELKRLDASAPGKRAYVRFLEERYESIEELARRRGMGVGSVDDFSDLLTMDLGAEDAPLTLHSDDAAFYSAMWAQAIAYLVQEIRRHSADVLIFSPRLIGLREFPDPWLDAWLVGVGPHVDAFIPELYATDDARSIVDHIGAKTGRPSFVGDGMRLREFGYENDDSADRREAVSYREMFTSLLGSRWFLGSTVCEYRPRRPEFVWYAADPGQARSGVRKADYSDRPALLGVYRELHAKKYTERVRTLAR